MSSINQLIDDALAAIDQGVQAASVAIKAKTATTPAADQQRVHLILLTAHARLREARMLFALAGGQTPKLNAHPALIDMANTVGPIIDRINQQLDMVVGDADAENIEDTIERCDTAADTIALAEFTAMSAIVHLSAALDLVEVDPS
jgi:hypothetical protein